MRHKQEKRKADRHVRLYHWLMRSAAWKNLPAISRALYAELAKHYNGSNNGRIGYSVREAADDLQVALNTANKHFHILTERGFIEPTKKGAFSLKERQATEWRLTEFTCDVSGMAPTKDFMRWQPPQIQNTVLKFETNGRNKRSSTVAIKGAEGLNTPSYGIKL
jgi:DNA-binding transcriptional MocR family regulator